MTMLQIANILLGSAIVAGVFGLDTIPDIERVARPITYLLGALTALAYGLSLFF